MATPREIEIAKLEQMGSNRMAAEYKAMSDTQFAARQKAIRKAAQMMAREILGY